MPTVGLPGSRGSFMNSIHSQSGCIGEQASVGMVKETVRVESLNFGTGKEAVALSAFEDPTEPLPKWPGLTFKAREACGAALAATPPVTMTAPRHMIMPATSLAILYALVTRIRPQSDSAAA